MGGLRSQKMAWLFIATLAPGAAAAQSLAEGLDLPECAGVHGPKIGTTTIDLPRLNVETEVEIGEAMITQVSQDVMEGGLRLEEDVTFTGTYVGQEYEVIIPAGDLQPIDGPNGRAYQSSGTTFKYRRESRPRRGINAPTIIVAPDPNVENGLIANVAFGFIRRDVPIESAGFSISACRLGLENSFRRELVYSGISQGSISITYREFSENLARPAFTQDLTYDLSAGREIGFRGLRFEVIEANNVGVRFVVTRPLAD